MGYAAGASRQREEVVMLRSGRLAASWELVKQSWSVLRSDKRLAIFPILSGIACALVTVVFLAPMVLAGLLDQALAGAQGARVVSAIVAFVFYFVVYFVIIFANAALVGAVLRKLDGQSATLSDGFRIALAHLSSIFGYAVIAATVGMLLRWLRDQARQGNGPLAILGQLGVGLLGAAWNIATFLVIPVLVIENVGPLEAIKRSVALLKRTWGEQIVGNVGIGLVFGLASFLTLLVGVGLIIGAAALGIVALIVFVVILTVFALLILAVVGNTLSGIYRAAVYRYAATGEVSGGFSPQLVQGAFAPRQSPPQVLERFDNGMSGGL
jgi:hypothetical protein